MIQVSTQNDERTIDEMREMWDWLINTFGSPEPSHPGTWTYGKEWDWVGSTFCSDPSEIEWIKFNNEKDATIFLLRWHSNSQG